MKQIILLVILAQTLCLYNIMDFGAVTNSDTVPDQFKNQQALIKAIHAANASSGQRIVRVPEKKFYSMPTHLTNIHNITFQIMGKWVASKSVRHWPLQPNSKYYQDFMAFDHCSHLTFTGGGKIDGRGYHWWMLLFLNDKKWLGNQNWRPHLVHFRDTHYITMFELTLKNSPQWFVRLDGCNDGHFYNMDIKVNTTAQINLAKKFSLQGSVIMFPFNTDGFDPSGARHYFHNLTVQNWDDVVVPKPRGEKDCTRDMLIEDCKVRLGVGMSIGSVPPSKDGACIRNITFRNIEMKRPLKGIYLKSNPGDEGSGIVEDIYFKNFTMDRPVWWAIYLGPQQMKEPDGDGPGCMLYPLGPCSTQPRVTFRNITLEDVKIHKSLLYPYTIRCNVSNPCTDINFYNVYTDSWRLGLKKKGYVCEFAMGHSKNTVPKIACLDQLESEDGKMEEQSLQQTQYGKSFFEDVLQHQMTGFKLATTIFEQMQLAAHEVGYFQQDDQFDYDMQFMREEENEDLMMI